ncbi:MAG: MFS transporter [Gemmatimonadales bacterium]|nr:MFS transporter [Gemmatimonadales bacterium]
MTEAVRRYGFGAFAHRNFRLFLFGQTVSLTGTWMQSIAQGWLVLQLTNSPFYVGLVSALGSLGVLLFTLYAGVIADRTDKRRTVIITQTLQMLQAFALAALVWSGHVTTGSVMALAAFLGVVSAFDIPTRQAFIFEMVGKEDLMNAIALNTSIFNLTRVLGPVLAGFLIGAQGVAVCFFLNGVSYLAVIGSLLAMRLPPWTPTVAVGSAWEGFREVVAYLRSDRRASTLVVLTAIISIFGFPYLVLMPVFARDVLRVGAAGYGLLSAAVGIGAVAGALTVAVFSARIRKGRTLVGAGMLFGTLLAVFALSRSFAVALGVLVLVGAAMIVNNALTNTLLQTHVPDHLRGRVMGFYSFMFVGMAPLGAFQAGVVAERFGAPVAVGLGGAVSALAVAIAGWRVAELRRAI